VKRASPFPNVDPAGVPLLEVEGLSTRFRVPGGVVRAVEDVSFTLHAGRTLGIVGESGSGKTVLARSVMGLLPHNAERPGTIRYRGVDITGWSTRELVGVRGPEMAMVFQDPMTSLNPYMRVGRQITESLRWHLGLTKPAAASRAVALLDEVGIPSARLRADSYPHQLSGGMRQRATIAIALACSPRLLFADEPTTALDVTIQAQILDLLAAEQREREMGMVLVSHDLGVVAGRTDDIVVMYAGRVVEHAPTRALFAGLRMPYTQALLEAVPRLDRPSHSRAAVIPGRPPDPTAIEPGCRFAPRCPYVQARCRAEEPPLVEAGPGHRYRCWYPVDGPLRRSAATMSRGSDA
jgi:oligopeptide/dipeptide ABC transporter ATP-binding protein